MKGDIVEKHMQDGCVQLQGTIELWIAPMEEKILGCCLDLLGMVNKKQEETNAKILKELRKRID